MTDPIRGPLCRYGISHQVTVSSTGSATTASCWAWSAGTGRMSLRLLAGSNHRFLLGLVSGDRKNEFKAFGRDWNERSEIFREGWDLTKKSLTHPNRLHFSGNYYSKLTGSLSCRASA